MNIKSTTIYGNNSHGKYAWVGVIINNKLYECCTSRIGPFRNLEDLGYKIAATIGWGSFYLVSDEPISNIEELKGKEIYNTGKGLTPDIIFKEVLNYNNILEDDINLSYVGAASELAPLIISGKAKFAVIPEPALSTVMEKKPDLNILLNLNEEWSKNNNVKRGYPQSTLVIKEDFYNEIKDNGAYEDIISVLKEAEEYAINNPQETADICEKLGITVNKNVIDKSIKNSNLSFTEIEECVDEYKVYFNAISSDDKESGNEYSELFIER